MRPLVLIPNALLKLNRRVYKCMFYKLITHANTISDLQHRHFCQQSSIDEKKEGDAFDCINNTKDNKNNN